MPQQAQPESNEPNGNKFTQEETGTPSSAASPFKFFRTSRTSSSISNGKVPNESKDNAPQNNKHAHHGKQHDGSNESPKEVPNFFLFDLDLAEDTGLKQERTDDNDEPRTGVRFNEHDEHEDNEGNQDVEKQIKDSMPPIPVPMSQNNNSSNNTNATPNTKKRLSIIPRLNTDKLNNSETRERFQNKIMKGFRRNKSVVDSKSILSHNDYRDHFSELEEKSKLKSDKFIDSMVAGAPIALLTATMLLSDDANNKRAPLLFQLLSLSLTDITDPSEPPNSKKRMYRFDLEYGIGQNTLKWSIRKSLKDIMSLHHNLRLAYYQSNVIKPTTSDVELPKFPKFKAGLNNDEKSSNKIFKNSNNSKKTAVPDIEIQNESHQGTRNNSSKNLNLASHTSMTNNKQRQSVAGSLYSGSLPNSPTVPNSQRFSSAPMGSNPHQLALGEDSALDATISPTNVSSEAPYLGINEEDLHYTHSQDSPVSINSGRSNHSIHSGHSLGDSIETTLSAWKQRFKMRTHMQSTKHRSPQTPEQYREKLELYFEQLCRVLTFKVNANKVFQFFELSPIGVLLTNENKEKRKEGNLFIRTTAKAQGWRVGHLRASDLKAMVDRHTPKWFFIGDSYIAYVNDIYSTTPLDVFLIDSKFKFTLQGTGVTINNENFKELLERPNEDDDGNSLIVGDDDDANSLIIDSSSKKSSSKAYFTLTMENSERKMSTLALSAKQMKLWALAIGEMALESPWSKKNRFGSFAPVRHNCFAQWIVDGRDYFWAASSAIEMATDVIYIHDWWLSPELYMRRPGNGNQFWRLDRLLKRKAEQGVKIFVIVYRNVANTVVTDSLWTKHSLLDLHDNVYVLRSPNQLMQNVYFWAHHEKLLIVDQNVCFVGGIDLCFGRYDTPDHVLVDEKLPFSADPTTSSSGESAGSESAGPNPLDYQMFPGKDYSNARVKDFYDLNDPLTDMVDRQVVPRMPWHDVHMVTSGQVARDLSRHFVQRWNFLLRQKRPSRATPLLLPPSDLTPEEIEKLNLGGTCEVQLLRSSCEWSLGIQEHEQSIQNGYLKAIETSEKFIYIENQFFITSYEHDGVIIKNQIGEALVERIVRAFKNGETWKAIIVIPLMPGFQAQVDTKEGSSVRLIMQCQYMSISMGNDSIFAKLRKAGVLRPEDYIQFFSLRKYGKIGPNKMLVTEQLYIHAKILIADDRLAIIGSANINERSMRGTRDSEVCAMVRDKEMIDSHMDGKPYKVGKFAHTMRMRLMREHLGVDVDLLELVERRFCQIEKFSRTDIGIKSSTLPNTEQLDDDGEGEDNEAKEYDLADHSLSAMVELATRYVFGESKGSPRFKKSGNPNSGEAKDVTDLLNEFIQNGKEGKELDDIIQLYSFNHRAGNENAGIRDKKNFSTDARVTTDAHRKEVNGHGPDAFHSEQYLHSKDKVTKILQNWSETSSKASNDFNCLPIYEDVMEFLEEDDSSVDINTLNAERWDMLKRIHYLQKYLSKQKKVSEPETANGPSPSTTSSTTGVGTGTETGTGIEATPQTSNGENTNEKTSFSTAKSSASPNQFQQPTSSLSDNEIKEIDYNFLPQTSYSFMDPYAFEDPLDIDFYEGLWLPQAMKNSLIYRHVFHVQPDDSVQTWSDYKYFDELKKSFMTGQQEEFGNLGGDGVRDNDSPGLRPTSEELSEGDANGKDEGLGSSETNSDDTSDYYRSTLRRSRIAELERFRRGGNDRGSKNFGGFGGQFQMVYDRATAEKLLGLIKGNLVVFPTSWLKREVDSSNWFYAADKLPPLEIYD